MRTHRPTSARFVRLAADGDVAAGIHVHHFFADRIRNTLLFLNGAFAHVYFFVDHSLLVD